MVGINKTTEGHLNYLLHEAKKEQVYTAEQSTSASESIFKRDRFPSHGRLIRSGTLDIKLQEELLGNHEDKHASYHKLQVRLFIKACFSSVYCSNCKCDLF